ncbi:hypothetical protein GCM10011508_08910 [Flavobacterium lutivivi]|nr:hypothetical protein GCM10011508_08910 [Flavobacterium lutivivi]
MKSIVFSLLCVLSLNAQTITSSGTHFVDNIKDKGWSNANGDNFTNAKFKSYSGSCYVLLEVDETAEVSFHAFSKIKDGRLEFKLIDEKENQYFYCSATKECDLLKDVVLEKGKKYKLLFTGANANGNYEVTWKIK